MKTRETIAYIVIGILGFILFEKYQESKALHDVINTQNQTTKYYINKLGTVTATANTLKIDKGQLETLIASKDDSLSMLLSEFKEPSIIVKTKTETKIDTIFVPYETPIDFTFERFGNYKDSTYLSLDYKVTQQGLSLSDITIPNTQTSITGIKKKWFLGREHFVTDITNSNPYISTVDVKSYQVRYKKPFYDTRAFNMVVGAILGIYINSKLN